MEKLKPNYKRIYTEGCPHSSDVIVEENIHLKRFGIFVSSILLALIIALVIVVISFAVVTNRPPTALSYAMDDQGRVVQIEPIDQPYSQGRVIRFTTKTVEEAMHISFTDYQDHFLAMSTKFTVEGFNAYQKELVDKGWIEKITNDNLVMWIEIRQAPKFLSAGNGNGRYFYELAFDIDLFIGGGNKTFKPNRLNVRVLVVRTEDNLDGLKIQRILIGEKQ
ncbi:MULTISPECIES: DotI/IcmL family type IV secretion protein [Pseudoalteromonas]|uniref:DotI/IcmL family type IV secretion protein n=1 Tax=Pseudoalteromonas TaxID=53246 RepID=UPI0015836888|nr:MULTISPECIES: DotI/IcmL family type IV secretion protein [Pseudoalteromonas]MDI4652595.1 DotI/IcmL family type IV secretion protein [Pseudoalteromonas shioyasakiensis]NUJ38697.1 DotI/IcmL/TraM family protein [Pseudoalteromonas sp. 0303]